MSDLADSLRFRIDRGELKMPALIEAARKAMLGLSPLAAVRAVVSREFWVAAAKSVPDLVKHLVDVQVADVLVDAWKMHRDLKQYLDRTTYPPGSVSTRPITTHHIRATQSPYIEITIDSMPQGRIQFELELDVTVEAGILVIQDGRIMRLEAGKAKATGTLKCAGVVVAEHVSRPFEWKDGISFGAGIPIDEDASATIAHC